VLSRRSRAITAGDGVLRRKLFPSIVLSVAGHFLSAVLVRARRDPGRCRPPGFGFGIVDGKSMTVDLGADPERPGRLDLL
jgi:hypothetical protein